MAAGCECGIARDAHYSRFSSRGACERFDCFSLCDRVRVGDVERLPRPRADWFRIRAAQVTMSST